MPDDRYKLLILLEVMKKKEKLKAKKLCASEFISVLMGKLISTGNLETLIRKEREEVGYLEAEKDKTRAWPLEQED